jgi:hypothetical protein
MLPLILSITGEYVLLENKPIRTRVTGSTHK